MRIKKFKKFRKFKICALLIVLTLIVCALAACAGEEAAPNAGGGSNNAPPNAGDINGGEAAADARIMPDLPDMDYGGHIFRVLVRDDPQWPVWRAYDVYTESMDGEPVNDAVFTRNMNLAEWYGFEIKEVSGGAISFPVAANARAGTDDFDAILGTIQQSSTFARSGWLAPFGGLVYIDLTKPWWDVSANADMSINNKNFYAMGDMTLTAHDATWAILFNKQMAGDLGLEDLYELVESGDWTLDKLSEMGRKAARNLSGGDRMDHTDQWGFAGHMEKSIAFMVSAGERTVSKDSDDLPVLTVNNNPRASDVFDKVFELMTDESFVILAERYWNLFPEGPWGYINGTIFEESRALFVSAIMLAVSGFRNMEDDFGILPLPKYNSEQAQYFNTLQYNNATVYSVPSTSTNLERTGFILEAMAAESKRVLTPAYYEVTLQRKHARDEESAAMLDLIFSMRILDIGFVFNWQDLQGVYSGMVTNRRNLFTSMFDRMEPRIIADIESTIEAFGY
jgi:hypothetical protein